MYQQYYFGTSKMPVEIWNDLFTYQRKLWHKSNTKSPDSKLNPLAVDQKPLTASRIEEPHFLGLEVNYNKLQNLQLGFSKIQTLFKPMLKTQKKKKPSSKHQIKCTNTRNRHAFTF